MNVLIHRLFLLSESQSFRFLLCPMDPAALEKAGETFIAWNGKLFHYYGCSVMLPLCAVITSYRGKLILKSLLSVIVSRKKRKHPPKME